VSTPPDKGALSIKQAAWGHAQRVRKPLHDLDGGIAGSSLDVADVSTMDPRLVGKFLLAQAFSTPKATNISAQALKDVHIGKSEGV